MFASGNLIAQGSQEQIYIKSINVTGNKKTKRAVILRELSIQEGSIVAKDSVLAVQQLSRLRLMNIQLFNEVEVDIAPVSDDSADVNIAVLERFPIMPDPHFEFADRNFNVWWSEQNKDLRRLNLGLTLVHKNFRGNREQVSATAQLGYTQKFGLAYERPFLDKQQKHGMGFSVSALQNKEIAYITDKNKLLFYRDLDHAMLRQTQVALWYTYRPEYASTHKFSLAYQHYWIADTIAALNPEYFGGSLKQEDVLAFNYSYRYNNVDNWEYPLIGARIVGVFNQLIAFRNKHPQTTFYLQLDKYINPLPKWYASAIFRGRISFAQKQPYIFRKNLGYEFDYVRGYEYYVIDGDAFALLRLNLKRELLNVKIRLPIPYFQVIPLRVYGKVYGDAGIAHSHYNAPSVVGKTAMYAGGIGLDIVTLYDIKVRIEYTLNRLGEKALYLHKSGE
jgi:outer membrane protein assembly factor BamA